MRAAALVLALVQTLVSAAPWNSVSVQVQGVMRRDCEPWPAHPDNSTLDTIYAIAIARNVTPKVGTSLSGTLASSPPDQVLLATFETAWVESRVWPLDCGGTFLARPSGGMTRLTFVRHNKDQDSVGAFQQRPSQGWGSIEECTNTTYATNAFLNVAIPKDKKNPSFSAGELAQSVQMWDPH